MILGLCGYARVGKDTLCEQLQNFQRVAFADILKLQVKQMLKVCGIEADLWGEDKEQWRDMLVFWGRKMRSRERDYWVKQLYARHAEAMQNDRVCITDVRYLNEANWVRKHGGLVIGIERPGFRANNEEEAISIREVRIQRPDIPWIINDGTPRDLEVKAREILREYHNRQSGGSML